MLYISLNRFSLTLSIVMVLFLGTGGLFLPPPQLILTYLVHRCRPLPRNWRSRLGHRPRHAISLTSRSVPWDKMSFSPFFLRDERTRHFLGTYKYTHGTMSSSENESIIFFMSIWERSVLNICSIGEWSLRKKWCWRSSFAVGRFAGSLLRQTSTNSRKAARKKMMSFKFLFIKTVSL